MVRVTPGLASKCTQETGTPELKETPLYPDHKYRIDEIADLAGGKALQFTCSDAEQGS